MRRAKKKPPQTLDNLPLPDAAKIEKYERLPYKAVFDRLDLCTQFKPGKNKIGAIFEKFIESIYLHDEIAKEMDHKQKVIDGLRKIESKKNKVYRNWDSTYNLMNTFPTEFEEYLSLIPKVKNFEQRMAKLTDPEMIAVAEMEYERYKNLYLKCSGLQSVHKALQEARDDRDEARRILMEAEKELNDMRDREVKIANKISDDHAQADEKGLFVGRIFPQIHEGDILVELNTQEVENWEFAKVAHAIRTAQSPHVCVFKRYDYREDPLTGIWHSLDYYRNKGVFVDDPRLVLLQYVQDASMGNLDKVKEAVDAGHDINARDHSGASALQAAAENNYTEIVEYLVDAGADINATDNNEITPLLASCRKGLVGMVRFLLDKGADKYRVDAVGRGILFYATLSENIHLVKIIYAWDPQNRNITETYFNWTSLHVAADKGALECAKFLVEQKASIYRRGYRNETPEDCARKAKRQDVLEYLQTVRLTAAMQLVYTYAKEDDLMNLEAKEAAAEEAKHAEEKSADRLAEEKEALDAEETEREDKIVDVRKKASRIWIGEHDCLTHTNIEEMNVTHMICIMRSEGKDDVPAGLKWKGHRNSRKDSKDQKIDDYDDEKEEDTGKSFYKPGSLLASESNGDIRFKESDMHFKLLPLILDLDDDDRGESSWKEFTVHVEMLINAVAEAINGEENTLLIVDETGDSLSPAVFCSFVLLKRQVRIEDAVSMCTNARPSVSMSLSLRRGLEILQRNLDDKRLKRLRANMRNAQSTSVAF